MSSFDTLRMTTVEQSIHTHTATAAAAAAAYFLQTAPRVEVVGILVFSIFVYFLVSVFGRCHSLECKFDTKYCSSAPRKYFILEQ